MVIVGYCMLDRRRVSFRRGRNLLPTSVMEDGQIHQSPRHRTLLSRANQRETKDSVLELALSGGGCCWKCSKRERRRCRSPLGILFIEG